MADTDRLVWLDLEMTGLDPEKERIIEIAALVTDGELNVVAEGPDLIVHQPDELLEAMDEWNTKHHGASGLVAAVKASTLSEQEAGQQVLDFVKEHCAEGEAPLAGNSIQRDRRFMRRYMAALDAWLHYRIVDVTSVKELVRRWYPEVYAARPKKKDAHRAMDDVKDSLAELRYYRAHAFKPPPAPPAPPAAKSE